MNKTPRIPDATHPISIEPETQRLVIKLQGRVLVDTRHALRLQEASYPVVHYVPRADVDMAQLTPSTHVTYCPYKGECSYFSLPADGSDLTNAVWSYEHPYAAVTAIQGHLAFYKDRVDPYELS